LVDIQDKDIYYTGWMLFHAPELQTFAVIKKNMSADIQAAWPERFSIRSEAFILCDEPH
jgi:hypothetical protein